MSAVYQHTHTQKTEETLTAIMPAVTSETLVSKTLTPVFKMSAWM